MDASGKRAGSLALMVVGAIMALACVSAIGAATTLVVMAIDTGPAEAIVPHDRECSVVAWKAGELHCLRGVFAGTHGPARGESAVVAQAVSAR